MLINSTSGTGGMPSSASAAHEKVHVEAILENSVVRRAFGQRDAVPPVVYPNTSTRPAARPPLARNVQLAQLDVPERQPSKATLQNIPLQGRRRQIRVVHLARIELTTFGFGGRRLFNAGAAFIEKGCLWLFIMDKHTLSAVCCLQVLTVTTNHR